MRRFAHPDDKESVVWPWNLSSGWQTALSPGVDLTMSKLSDEGIKTFLTYPSLDVRDMAWELLAAREVIRATGPVLQRFQVLNNGMPSGDDVVIIKEEEAVKAREYALTLKTALAKYVERAGA